MLVRKTVGVFRITSTWVQFWTSVEFEIPAAGKENSRRAWMAMSSTLIEKTVVPYNYCHHDLISSRSD